MYIYKKNKSKRNNMPKPVKKKSNAFVGGIKSQPKTKKILLGVAVVMVVALVGFLGFSMYKARSLKAQAAGWTQLYNTGSYAAWACQERNAFGHFVRVVMVKPQFVGKSYTMGLTTNEVSGTMWWGNYVAGTEQHIPGGINWTHQILANIDGVTNPTNRWQVATLRSC